MYYQAVRQFILSLQNLDACLGKAEAYAASRKFDVNNLFGARLAPDMLPFSVQIAIACDNAKGTAANLSGRPNEKHEDNQATFADLRARIAKCVAFLETFSEADFANADGSRLVTVPYPPGGWQMPADAYLWSRQVPQFYFHMNMAYAILRHNGVDIGKADYLGKIDLRPPA